MAVTIGLRSAFQRILVTFTRAMLLLSVLYRVCVTESFVSLERLSLVTFGLCLLRCVKSWKRASLTQATVTHCALWRVDQIQYRLIQRSCCHVYG